MRTLLSQLVSVLLLQVATAVPLDGAVTQGGDIYRRNFTMPGASPKAPDAYLCTTMALDPGAEEWVVRYDPLASANRAHHMLLYGCSGGKPRSGYWDCGHHGACPGGQIMYAWAKNAPSLTLPPDVGFRIGGGSGAEYLTLQIHYAKPLNGLKDHSGLTLELTKTPQKYIAGILLMVDGGTVIEPHKKKVHANMVCEASQTGVTSDIFIFGSRVHTHSLGVVVSGYKVDHESNEYVKIAKGNPQWPQAFYPREEVLKVSPQDTVAATCTFNSEKRDRTTYIGGTDRDEMCNMYLMYYTDKDKGKSWSMCSGVHDQSVALGLPSDYDEALPPNPLLEEKAKGENSNLNEEVTYKTPIVDKTPIVLDKKAHHYTQIPATGMFDYPNSPVQFSDYMEYSDYPSRSSRFRPSRRRRPLLQQPDYPNRQLGVFPKYGAVNPVVGMQYPSMNQDAGYGINSKRVMQDDQDYGGGVADDKFQLHPKPVTPFTSPEQTNIIPQTTTSGAQREGKVVKVSDYKVSTRWGDSSPILNQLGQVTAVETDDNNDVFILHRGDKVWDASTFNEDTNILTSTTNPIQQPTIIKLRGSDGALLQQMGNNTFFMPHGITVDHTNHIWVTDVGMHQVFKFPPNFGDGKPILTLGTRFKPGNDDKHFCKPTSVAVLTNGDFYVADGYCNGRVIKYRENGEIVTQFGEMAQEYSIFDVVTAEPSTGVFNVVHSLALAEDKHELCIADREQGRVQCYDTSDQPKYTRGFDINKNGARLFAVAYSPFNGGRIFCVNGPTMFGTHKVEVYEFEFDSGRLIRSFSPQNQGFTNPHDLSVSRDGAEVYVGEIGPNKIWRFVSDGSILLTERLPSTDNSSLLQTAVSTVTDFLTAPIRYILNSILKNRPKLEASKEANLHANQILGGVGSGLNKLTGVNHILGEAKWSTLGISIVILGLLLVPIVVLSTVSLIVHRRQKAGRLRAGSMFSANGSTKNGWTKSDANGIHQLGSSLLNKHRGFRKLATEECDELSSGESDIEEFSQIATKA